MSDHDDIAGLVEVFFAAFTSGPDLAQRMDALRAAMLPSAVVVRTCGQTPAVYDVEGFLAPRYALLSGGSLTDFREWPTSGRTEVAGDVAHHWCTYAKQWWQDGEQNTGRGVKSVQCVRTDDGWRISAAAWDDERDGLPMSDTVETVLR